MFKFIIAGCIVILFIIIITPEFLFQSKMYHSTSFFVKKEDQGKELNSLEDFTKVINNCGFVVVIKDDIVKSAKINHRGSLTFYEEELNLGLILDTAALIFNSRYEIDSEGKIIYSYNSPSEQSEQNNREQSVRPIEKE